MALAALLLRSVALILIILALHRLTQYLFASKDEPPVVHHWLPFVGSAITYGQDPYAFFFRCREKVSVVCSDSDVVANIHNSTAMSSLSSFLARR